MTYLSFSTLGAGNTIPTLNPSAAKQAEVEALLGPITGLAGGPLAPFQTAITAAGAAKTMMADYMSTSLAELPMRMPLMASAEQAKAKLAAIGTPPTIPSDGSMPQLCLPGSQWFKDAFGAMKAVTEGMLQMATQIASAINTLLTALAEFPGTLIQKLTALAAGTITPLLQAAMDAATAAISAVTSAVTAAFNAAKALADSVLAEAMNLLRSFGFMNFLAGLNCGGAKEMMGDYLPPLDPNLGTQMANMNGTQYLA